MDASQFNSSSIYSLLLWTLANDRYTQSMSLSVSFLEPPQAWAIDPSSLLDPVQLTTSSMLYWTNAYRLVPRSITLEGHEWSQTRSWMSQTPSHAGRKPRCEPARGTELNMIEPVCDCRLVADLRPVADLSRACREPFGNKVFRQICNLPAEWHVAITENVSPMTAAFSGCLLSGRFSCTH